jgi:hypothetical protein
MHSIGSLTAKWHLRESKAALTWQHATLSVGGDAPPQINTSGSKKAALPNGMPKSHRRPINTSTTLQIPEAITDSSFPWSEIGGLCKGNHVGTAPMANGEGGAVQSCLAKPSISESS